MNPSIRAFSAYCFVLLLVVLVAPPHAQAQGIAEATASADTFPNLHAHENALPALQRPISVDFNDVTLADALAEIARQSGLGLSYSPDTVPVNRLISLQIAEGSVAEALDALTAHTSLRVLVTEGGELILIEGAKKENTTNRITGVSRRAVAAPFRASRVERMVPARIQHEVRGQVTDAETGESLPGVNVVVQGTTTGTITDPEGEYELTVPSGDGVLVFSFVGYLRQEVPIEQREEINVALQVDVAGLDELVVVGYGTQRRGSVVGSISRVSNEELTASPVSRVSNALAGRLPGAIVQQRSGEPGSDQANILIRGSATLGDNAPLIVIDGIQGRNLDAVHPDDIESITLLKDASAAIYGARAANGVILVTTKRGRTNTAPEFSYRSHVGFLSPTMVPEFADAATYATMIREMQLYRGVDEANMTFSLEDIEKYESGEYPWTHPNTNWMGETLRSHSLTNHHSVTVGGGTEDVTYYASFGAQLDGAIYQNTDMRYNRYNLRANADMDINEYLSVGIDISGSLENRLRPVRSSGDIYASVMRAKPTDHARYPNGLPGPEAVRDQQPVITPSLELGSDDENRYRLDNILSATLHVPGVDGLSVSGHYAYDLYLSNRKRFEIPWTVYDFDVDGYLAAGNTGSEDGSGFILPTHIGSEPHLNDYYDNSTRETINLRADYTRTINNVHNISTFAAFERFNYLGQGIQAFRRHFVSDRLPYLFAGGDAEKDNSGWVDVDAQVNYFGRFSYDYNSTYLMEVSFRRDGSLRFSEENGRWGNFPSVLVGWRPSQHDWWHDSVGFVDELKFRASWGQMGNDRIPPFQYLASYGFGTGAVLGANRSYYQGLSQVGAPNPFITWEVANVYNAGWESTLLNNRIRFDVDLFYERRSDILVRRNASVPNFTGISLPDENFGVVDNRGMELVLGYRDGGTDFSYGITGNMAFARNTVVEFDEPARSVPWQVRTGRPQGATLLYQSAGIFRDWDHVNSLPHVPGARPGDIIIADTDGDGEITPDDRILFDYGSDPEITYGISFDASYRSWSLTGLVQGVGNTMRRLYTDKRQGSAGNYYQYQADGRWTPDNIDATKPRAFEREEEYWRGAFETDYSYVNAAFARLKNLQLSYTLPQEIQSMLNLSNAQVYLAGQNLFLIYSGNDLMDPELRGMNNYPLMRVMSFGTSISF